MKSEYACKINLLKDLFIKNLTYLADMSHKMTQIIYAESF